MMCSSWKISLFGIVAFMLAFGLVTTDALADDQGAGQKHASDHDFTVMWGTVAPVAPASWTLAAGQNIATASDAQQPTNVLRAADKAGEVEENQPVYALQFTYTPPTATDTDVAGGRDKGGSIKIRIPSRWPLPTNNDGDDTPEPGEIIMLTTSTEGNGTPVLSKSQAGGVITVNVNADQILNGTVTVIYIFGTVPNYATDYDFRVTSDVPPAYHLNRFGDDIEGFDDQGQDYVIPVYAAKDGTGSVALATLFKDTREDKTPPRKDQYFAYAKQSIGNLSFTYRPAGTMLKGSVVQLLLPGDTGDEARTPADSPDWLPASLHVGTDVTVSSGVKGSTANTDIDGIQTANIAVATLDRTFQAGQPITITLKGITAPHADDNILAVGTYPFVIRTLSSLPWDTDNNADTDPEETGGLVPLGSSLKINVTAPHGKGEIKLSAGALAEDGANELKHAKAEEEFKDEGDDIQIRFQAKGAMASGAQVKVTIPDGWSDPLPDNGDAVDTPGEITLGAFSGTGTGALEVDGRVVTVTLTLDMVNDETFVLNYSDAKAPAAPGLTEFKAAASSGPHASPVAIASAPVYVTADHGTGTMKLTKGGRELKHVATKEIDLGDLVFTYTAAGYMAPGAKVQVTFPGSGWSDPREDNNDGKRTPGEVSVPSSSGEIESVAAGVVTIKTTVALNTGNTIRLNYRTVKAGGDGSHKFETRAISFSDGRRGSNLDIDGTILAQFPIVGVAQPPDGTGTMVLSNTGTAFTVATTGEYVTTASEGLGTVMFTFTAGGKMTSGSQVTIDLPEEGNWPEPIRDDGDTLAEEGEVSVAAVPADPDLSVGLIDVSREIFTVEITGTLEKDAKFAVSYKNVTAPTAGDYDFAVKSKVTAEGTLTSISGSPLTIRVRAVDPGAVTSSVNSANPGESLGDLVFTYTAAANLDAGVVIQITIPEGWQQPSRANDEDDARSGAVSLSANAGITSIGTAPMTIVATTNSAVADGETVTFTYRSITTPSKQDTYPFDAAFSLNSEDPVEDIPSPSIVVRDPVTAIAIEAASEFFAVDGLPFKVTLWGAGGAANALNDMVVTLSDGDGGGSFEDSDGNTIISVTITDNTDAASAVYQNASAGEVTLTATSEMEGVTAGAHVVTVKSGITNLDADPKVVSAGQDVKITATGKKGGGNVSLSFVDAEGNTVSLDKGLDPIDDPDVGADEQSYTRTIMLPAAIPEGEHDIMVTIANLSDSVTIEVVNDQSPPTVSNADASKAVVVNGDTFTLSVDVAMNESMVAIVSVIADLGGLDTTQATVPLDELSSSPGTYFTIITVDDSIDNTAEDGEYTITITATDTIGNTGSDTVMVTLENDPSELTRVWIEPGCALQTWSNRLD